jgi:hypothetical protein
MLSHIPHLLQNQKFHYSVRKSMSPVSILCQMNAIHTPNPISLIYFYIILSSMPRSSKSSLLLSTCHTHLILDLITLIYFHYVCITAFGQNNTLHLHSIKFNLSCWYCLPVVATKLVKQVTLVAGQSMSGGCPVSVWRMRLVQLVLNDPEMK